MKKLIILALVVAIFSPQSLLAEVNETTPTSVNQKETITKGNTVTLQNPIGENDPRVILGNILRVVLGLVGSIALVVFVFGGLTWMTSAGNSDRVTQGRDTLIWAAIGLIVIFASYTLVAFILQTITGA